MPIVVVVLLALACLVALVAASYLIEWLRPLPKAPQSLAWAPHIAIEYADLGTTKVRYIRTGTGPNLVLLHTLRTQLDIFQRLVAPLAQHFSVYAFDYPGHGWSDIPSSDYAPDDFYAWTAAFLERLDITDATLAGVSIGGTIALVLAARENPRVRRVICINPYDYWPSGGVRRSSLTARLILSGANIPIFGATVMRLRNRFVSDRIMEGGVASPATLPRELARELYAVGNRPGHYQGFLSLLAHEHRWPEARKEYPSIKVPVLLIYGEHDWAPSAERQRDRALIPMVPSEDVASETVAAAGHFLPLDRPDELRALIMAFARV
jgi:pimeloyl-ACP methyl ester carboxylesterase